MDIAIHTNANYAHQREQAELFRKGFLKHNLKSTITTSIQLKADIHIVLGSNYAKNYWLSHEHVILLDRCYFGNTKEFVSIGWMNSDGGRNYKIGSGRRELSIRCPIGNKSLFLADYNGVTEQADIIRLHPANEKHYTSLQETFNQCDRATGYNTTALVQAALAGLKITCKGNASILNNNNWINLLPYANWHYNEINSGEVWEHLRL